MGLSSSPYVFSKLSDFVVRSAIRRGASRIVCYLDDYCVIGSTEEECRTDQHTLISTLRHIGFSISYKKLSSPARKTRFLGIDVDSEKMNLSLPEDKMQKMIASLKETTRKKKVTKKQLEKTAGYLAHASKVVRGGGCSAEGFMTP